MSEFAKGLRGEDISSAELSGTSGRTLLARSGCIMAKTAHSLTPLLLAIEFLSKPGSLALTSQHVNLLLGVSQVPANISILVPANMFRV